MVQVKIPRQSPKPSTDKELIRYLQREIWELRAQLADQNRQPSMAGSCCEAADSQLSAESAADVSLAAQITLCAQTFDTADSQRSALSAAMSAVSPTVPFSLETDSDADASDESCGVPTPDKEKERYTIARLEGRLDQMSPEAKATQETERAASRNGHSLHDWQGKHLLEGTLDDVSAHVGPMQHSEIGRRRFVEGWHGGNGLVGELASIRSAGLNQCRCGDVQGVNGASTQMRQLKHKDLEQMADDLLLELINDLIQVRCSHSVMLHMRELFANTQRCTSTSNLMHHRTRVPQFLQLLLSQDRSCVNAPYLMPVGDGKGPACCGGEAPKVDCQQIECPGECALVLSKISLLCVSEGCCGQCTVKAHQQPFIAQVCLIGCLETKVCREY